MIPVGGNGEPRGRAGFSLLEVSIAVAILTITVLSLASAEISAAALRGSARQSQFALRAVGDRVEYLRSLDLARATQEVTSPAGGSHASGPGWATTLAQIDSATVAGKSVRNLRITVMIASEAETSALFGAAIDVNGDGTTSDEANTGAGATILPIKVFVNWEIHDRKTLQWRPAYGDTPTGTGACATPEGAGLLVLQAMLYPRS